jgi:tetratricopeptide (TPR) repeat protein
VNRENNGFRSDENVRLLRYAVKEARANNLSPHETADAFYSLAEDLQLRGQLDESESLFRQALAAYGDDPSSLCDRSTIYGDLAYVQEMRGDVAASLPTFQLAYQGASKCSGPDSFSALDQQQYVADALTKLSRAPEAYAIMTQSMPAWRKVSGDSPQLSEPLYFLAEAAVATGHFEQAEAAAKEAAAVQTGKVDAADRRWGVVHMIWARALAGEHRPAEALPHAEIAARLLSNGVSPGARKVDADAHQLLLDLQSQLHEK